MVFILFAFSKNSTDFICSLNLLKFKLFIFFSRGEFRVKSLVFGVCCRYYNDFLGDGEFVTRFARRDEPNFDLDLSSDCFCNFFLHPCAKGFI